MSDSSKTIAIMDRCGKPKATATIHFHPDPYGDRKLQAVMFILGYSDKEIDRVIEERQIRRSENT